MQRTNSRRLALVLAAGLLVVSNLSAQNEPVRNWAAPLYWQPSEQEASIIRHAHEMQPRAGAPAPQTTADPSVPLVFVAITPCRLVDTRLSTMPYPYGGGASAPLAWGVNGGDTHTIAASGGSCSLPAAQAYSTLVTVVPVPLGHPMQVLNAYPTGVARPFTATLTDYPGAIAGGAAVIPTGTPLGSFDVWVTDPAWVIIDVNGYYASPTDLQNNTALGNGALVSITTGSGNTASGASALYSNTTGGSNTASGFDALQSNTTGPGNTASGAFALQDNTTGFYNTASGVDALLSNTTGSDNTASGAYALRYNTTGNLNTASGALALEYNTTGSFNTASGDSALVNNTTGNTNTAVGLSALYFNATGSNNTASGAAALQNNTTGSANTASGVNALLNNTIGGNNIAIGNSAALSVSGGNSNNIHIGSRGASGDNGAIRIGGNTALGDPAAQNSFFAAGISGVTTGSPGAVPVFIDSNGQLGTVSSSRRVKTDIAAMGDTTETLMSLRPVQFRYIAHGAGAPLQYGLIAEEVAEVAPELVAHNANGEIETVFYDKVNAMLLNQVQTQQRLIESQKEQIESQETQFQSQLESQKEHFTGLISQLESRLAELENRVK